MPCAVSEAEEHGPESAKTDVTATSEPIPQELIERSFAGRETERFPDTVYESIQPIENSASGFIPVPDRWRMFYAG